MSLLNIQILDKFYMLIPDNINSFNSNGEKFLYWKFKDDNNAEGYYVLHSLFTNHHSKSISGEIDFLLLIPGKGIFALEVKHGRVSRRNGTWYFKNRFGNENKSKIGPFSQVSASMHSIRNFILNKIEDEILKNRIMKIVWGTGVAFTSLEIDDDFNPGPESFSFQILDKLGMVNPIRYYLKSLSDGWHNILSKKGWYNHELSKPSKEDCEFIIKILRGDLDVRYTINDKIQETNTLIERYTEEQFSLLDFTNYNDRSLIVGGAGTGKTIMAIELAQKYLDNGKKVGFLCFNKKLGAFLESRFKSYDLNDSFIGTFHNFLYKHVDSKSNNIDNDYFSTELPFQYLIENEESYKEFDVLIIDEIQDLLTDLYLEVFNTMLTKGMNNGKWIFFGDFSNQAIYSKNIDLSLNNFKEKYNFVSFPKLKINCRNSLSIAEQNTLMTGTEKLEVNQIDIPERILDYFTENSLVKVEEILKKLEIEKVEFKQITVLSVNKGDVVLFPKWKKKGVIFSTIHSFKGLENTIVILFGFKNILTDSSQKLLYIGISRAKQRLYLVLDTSLKKDYAQLIKKNIKLI